MLEVWETMAYLHSTDDKFKFSFTFAKEKKRQICCFKTVQFVYGEVNWDVWVSIAKARFIAEYKSR